MNTACSRMSARDSPENRAPGHEERDGHSSLEPVRSVFRRVGLLGGASLILGVVLAGCSASSLEMTTGTQATCRSANVETTTSNSRVITSSTELIKPPVLARPLTRLVSTDIALAGITVITAENSGGHGSAPGILYLRALADSEQGITVYQAIAEKMISLALEYKEELYFDRVHVVLAPTQCGEALYDHTFQVTPPSSTTSTALPFVIRYSAPSLEVRPRAGVTLAVDVSYYRGTVVLDVEITNDSSSAFHFPQEDLQLYVNNVRVERTQEEAGWPTEFAAGSGGSSYIYLTVPQFDPYAAGLLYISSDPESYGFTASDGPAPEAHEGDYHEALVGLTGDLPKHLSPPPDR